LSIAARAPIVATITTLLFVPVTTENGTVLGHEIKKRPTHTLRCARGKPIPPTPLAKRLGVDGQTCKARIARKVRVKPKLRP
jgi:hypothetical protein